MEKLNYIWAINNDAESIVFRERTDSNSSPRDMTSLLGKVAMDDCVSKECSSAIHEVLLKKQYQQRIGGLLPRNTKLANKTGNLESLFNDTGIVQLPNGKGVFAITVYSIGSSLVYKGDEPIARISQITYENFVGNDNRYGL